MIQALFLFYACLLLPWRVVRRSPEWRGHSLSKSSPALDYSVLVTKPLRSIPAGLAPWSVAFVASTTVPIDSWPTSDWQLGDLALGTGVFLVFLLDGRLLRWLYGEKRYRTLPALSWGPQGAAQWLTYGLIVVVMATALEVAYRVVVPAVVASITGSEGLGVVVSAIAFSFLSTGQGRWGTVLNFVFALAQHGLLASTGSVAINVMVTCGVSIGARILIDRERRSWGQV